MPSAASAAAVSGLSRASRFVFVFVVTIFATSAASAAGAHAATIMRSCSVSSRPGNTGSPLMSSARRHPADHTSTRPSYAVAPISSSGGRYHSVTTVGVSAASRSPTPFFLFVERSTARPQSASFRFPVASTSRLLPLTSRCRIPSAWLCSSAVNSCQARRLTCPRRKPPSSVHAVRPAMSCSRYSSTRKTDASSVLFFSLPPKSTAMSSSRTACAWWRSLSRIEISRAANAHASNDAKDAGLIFFNATRRPSRSSTHAYTAPYVPKPTCFIFRNDARSLGPSSERRASPACATSQVGQERCDVRDAVFGGGISNAESSRRGVGFGFGFFPFFSPSVTNETLARDVARRARVTDGFSVRSTEPRASKSRESDPRRRERPAFGSTGEPAAVASAREDGAG